MSGQRRVPPRSQALETLEERMCFASSVGWDGPGLGTASLTYYIENGPSTLSAAAVESAIEAALDAWSAVARITFVQTSTPNLLDSLDFNFERIDGRNGTLAYAYLPDDLNSARIAGDVTFDSSERWEVGNSQGSSAFDLVITAVHEIGHALGLEHSDITGSVMADSISANSQYQGLASADVTSIRSLYASTDTAPSITTNEPQETPVQPRRPRFRIPRHRFPRGNGR